MPQYQKPPTRKQAALHRWKKWIWAGALGMIAGLLITIGMLVILSPFRPLMPGIMAGLMRGGQIVVLVMNEAEIRGSGGFISAIGTIRINGIMPTIEVRDVYDILPPEEAREAPPLIAEALGISPEKGWEARDASVLPFFDQAAQAVLELSEGDALSERETILVVGLTLDGFEHVVEDLENGTLLPEESTLFWELHRSTKTVDLHNQEALAERKGALSVLMEELRGAIGPRNILGLQARALELIPQRDLQMYAPGERLQKKIESMGASGSPHARDGIGLAINNLGAKKSDRYRVISQEVTRSYNLNGGWLEETRIRLNHHGEENLQSGEGQYGIHIMRSLNSQLTQKSQREGWRRRESHGMAIYERLVTLTPGEEEEIQLSITAPVEDILHLGQIEIFPTAGTEVLTQLNLLLPDEYFWLKEEEVTPEECQYREHFLSCSLILKKRINVPLSVQPDLHPPILEDSWWADRRTLVLRGSEAIKLPPAESITFSCPGREEDYAIEAIAQNNPEQARDFQISLSEEPPINVFCKLDIEQVQDSDGNSTSWAQTIPTPKAQQE